MSVLVEDVLTKSLYVFVKGAPEKLQKNSINLGEKNDKRATEGYHRLVRSLSLEGMRTIAVGFKILKQQER